MFIISHTSKNWVCISDLPFTLYFVVLISTIGLGTSYNNIMHAPSLALYTSVCPSLVSIVNFFPETSNQLLEISCQVSSILCIPVDAFADQFLFYFLLTLMYCTGEKLNTFFLSNFKSSLFIIYLISSLTRSMYYLAMLLNIFLINLPTFLQYIALVSPLQTLGYGYLVHNICLLLLNSLCLILATGYYAQKRELCQFETISRGDYACGIYFPALFLDIIAKMYLP